MHMQLKNNVSVCSVTGPPFIDVGSVHLMNHGKPKHSSMSIVLEPRALLMLMDPSPVKVIKYYVIYKTNFLSLLQELTV